MTYNIFGTVVLFIPPSYKEGHFYPHKGPVGVILEFFYDCVQYVLNTSSLNISVSWRGILKWWL